jgi:hypothetical protein
MDTRIGCVGINKSNVFKRASDTKNTNMARNNCPLSRDLATSLISYGLHYKLWKKMRHKMQHNKTKTTGAKLLRSNFVVGAILSSLYITSSNAFSDTAAWLAADLTTAQDEARISAPSLNAYFNDDVVQTTTTTQNIRILKREVTTNKLGGLVDSMMVTEEIGAEQWLSMMPVPEPKMPVSDNAVAREIYECSLDAAMSRVSCDAAHSLSIETGTALEAPTKAVYGQSLVAQIAREAGQLKSSSAQDLGASNSEALRVQNNVSPVVNSETMTSVTLVPRKDGLITVAGKNIKFTAENQAFKVLLDPKLAQVEVSLFVRDPSIVYWDDKAGLLTAKKSGATEVFVVSPGRISIVEVSVQIGTQTTGGLAGVNNSGSQISALGLPTKVLARGIELPKTLASLDGLDSAASKGVMAASNSGVLSEPTQLVVADEVSKLGPQGLNEGSHFVRAKAKTNFQSLKIKIIDDRSRAGQENYPVGGIRIKVAGTEFSQLTNGLGEVEIQDVPSGARLLLDISDERGYIMPQLTEIEADRGKSSRSLAQLVPVLRFSSLDVIARAVGVVEDMQKSSFCGSVTDHRVAAAGIIVSLDAAATGPIYFNRLGLPDLTLGSSGPGGRFCFFNVEPGPVAVAIRKTRQATPVSGVVGLVSGRHAEEIFEIAEAGFVTTTLTTIATANEQLGSDATRSSRHDIVDQADIYAVGSGELMVPVDDGVMTTANPVLPIKGRVWTVSASPDFETSVQAVSVRAPAANQISTLVPNGFVSDMSNFSQTSHNSDEGSVIIEHGTLAGQGSEPVKIRLTDAFGQDVGDGWYFADQPVSKAIFFNVPPGIYAVVVETSSGHWLAADTVIVYSESVSIAKTGGQLQKLPLPSQHAMNE